MSGDRFSAEPTAPVVVVEKESSGCLKGCLIALVICVVIAVVVAIWVATSWRNWAGDLATVTINAMMDASDLPPAEKAEVQAQFDRVIVAFKEDRLSGEQFTQFVERLSESPLFPMFLVSAIEAKYFDQSGLSDEEKAAGHVTLNRYMQASLNNKVPQATMDQIMEHIADRKPGGGDQWELKESVTDDQLRELLADAKAAADAAEIPAEIPEVDPSEEVRQIVDDVLGEAQGEVQGEAL